MMKLSLGAALVAAGVGGAAPRRVEPSRGAEHRAGSHGGQHRRLRLHGPGRPRALAIVANWIPGGGPGARDPRDPLALYHAGIAARDAGERRLALTWLGRAPAGNQRFSPLHGPRTRGALDALQ